MDFSLTKEQKEYISEVRKFSVENLNGNDEKDFFFRINVETYV